MIGSLTAYDYIERLAAGLNNFPYSSLSEAAALILMAYDSGGTIFTCGNGGSAATASHFAIDLAKATRAPDTRPLRVWSLVDHVPAVTAWGNDEGYERIFSAQLAAFAQGPALLIAISGSGNSANVVCALKMARAAGMSTVGLLGHDGGKARALCDIAVLAPYVELDQQEDMHLVAAHMLTRMVHETILMREGG